MKTAFDVSGERDEAARERERVRQEASERAQKESRLSAEERAKQANERSAEIRQERLSATNILTSGAANIQLATIASQGGPVGRKLEREIRQFQQTGRVSSWLAGETIKAEAAQNAAQQSAFRQAVIDVISIPQTPIQVGPTNSYVPQLSLKPEVSDEAAPATETCIGLALYVKDGDVWIGAGTVAGQIPSGFDQSDGKFIANGGSGNVWAEVNIDGDTGEIVSVSVDGGGNTPQNTNTSFYYTLGYYEYNGDSPSITNYGCGGIEVRICRNWFAAEAPFYGVTLSRCGCGGGGY